MTSDDKQTIRPTKKQRETLTYIEEFINEHGYSPSYREIMRACNYTSVATVALHVNNLIKRGHLIKRDHRARSLEVVSPGEAHKKLPTNEVSEAQEKWLVEKIDHVFSEAEHSANPDDYLDKLHVLVGALHVLGLEGAAQSFVARLTDLKSK
ncbi:MAG: hypothetical protein U5L95_04465 [Candidatus Saccharibacteria bacterium]|nr:hypothetical protein [Candidatus Saccharibacteria bacterium]